MDLILPASLLLHQERRQQCQNIDPGAVETPYRVEWSHYDLFSPDMKDAPEIEAGSKGESSTIH